MSDTPRTDAMEARVSSECRNLSDETRNWLMQAKSRELNCTLERELAAVKEQLADARRDAIAECWNAVNKYITHGPIEGNGCDELSKRNGMVLATNLIAAMKESI